MPVTKWPPGWHDIFKAGESQPKCLLTTGILGGGASQPKQWTWLNNSFWSCNVLYIFKITSASTTLMRSSRTWEFRRHPSNVHFSLPAFSIVFAKLHGFSNKRRIFCPNKRSGSSLGQEMTNAPWGSFIECSCGLQCEVDLQTQHLGLWRNGVDTSENCCKNQKRVTATRNPHKGSITRILRLWNDCSSFDGWGGLFLTLEDLRN